MSKSGDIVMEAYPLFQKGGSGSIPTSPLQFYIKQIPKSLAKHVYAKWHYLGKQDFVATHNFGAFYGGECLGAISFGPPPTWQVVFSLFGHKDQEGIFDIKRLAMKDECPKNSESRLIGVAIKLLRKETYVKAIITFADTAQGHVGTIYKATNFKYMGLGPQKSDFFINGKQMQRGKSKGKEGVWVPRSRKHRFIMEF